MAAMARCKGMLTNSVSSDPIPGVDILATLSSTQTFQIFTGVAGDYSLQVISGTYTVDASAFGYTPEQVTGVTVGDSMTVTQDFELDLLQTHVVSVTVVDANTGWPLYAKIGLLGIPLDPIWNDPLTGHLETSVPGGFEFQTICRSLDARLLAPGGGGRPG